jgi:hypothetical protein
LVPHAIQLLVEQVRRLAILTIVYVLFVFGSGDQATFSFNTSPILRRQEGLYIVNAPGLPQGFDIGKGDHGEGTRFTVRFSPQYCRAPNEVID